MFGIFGKMFGSDKVIDGAMRGIDALVFTDEEKAKMSITKGELKIKLLQSYEPFKLAQRYLALIFSGLFVAAFITALVLALLDMSYQPVLDIVESFSLGYIILAIVTFYFGGGLAASMKK